MVLRLYKNINFTTERCLSLVCCLILSPYVQTSVNLCWVAVNRSLFRQTSTYDIFVFLKSHNFCWYWCEGLRVKWFFFLISPAFLKLSLDTKPSASTMSARTSSKFTLPLCAGCLIFLRAFFKLSWKSKHSDQFVKRIVAVSLNRDSNRLSDFYENLVKPKRFLVKNLFPNR